MLKKGFTYLELIIVVAILGILAVMAIPQFMNLKSKSELAVAQHFGGSLKEARDLYYSRLLVDNAGTAVSPTNSFFTFVALSQYGDERNTIVVDNSIRSLFQDPNANVLQNDNALHFVFRSGATAIYTIDSNGAISEQFTGF